MAKGAGKQQHVLIVSIDQPPADGTVGVVVHRPAVCKAAAVLDAAVCVLDLVSAGRESVAIIVVHWRRAQDDNVLAAEAAH